MHPLPRPRPYRDDGRKGPADDQPPARRALSTAAGADDGRAPSARQPGLHSARAKASFLVVVAEETENGPAEPIAFRTAPGQGVNIGRNVWHGILTPLETVSDFAVVDRGGEGVNLEEHFYDESFLIR
jgi:hypothetical protein